MIKTGSEYLNSKIEGYPKNLLTIIYGKPATGKTTLALHLALEHARTGKVLFIDTENGLSLARMEQISPDFKSLLKNITVVQPKTFQQQENLILNLPKKFSIIIIDTIGKHYRLELKKDTYTANRSLDKQLKRLTEFIKNKVPVLICNQVYDNFNTNETTTLGGKIIKKYCQCSIHLKKDPRVFQMLEPIKNEFQFRIVGEGVVEP